jgi:hypothetical protein
MTDTQNEKDSKDNILMELKKDKKTKDELIKNLCSDAAILKDLILWFDDDSIKLADFTDIFWKRSSKCDKLYDDIKLHLKRIQKKKVSNEIVEIVAKTIKKLTKMFIKTDKLYKSTGINMAAIISESVQIGIITKSSIKKLLEYEMVKRAQSKKILDIYTGIIHAFLMDPIMGRDALELLKTKKLLTYDITTSYISTLNEYIICICNYASVTKFDKKKESLYKLFEFFSQELKSYDFFQRTIYLSLCVSVKDDIEDYIHILARVFITNYCRDPSTITQTIIILEWFYKLWDKIDYKDKFANLVKTHINARGNSITNLEIDAFIELVHYPFNKRSTFMENYDFYYRTNINALGYLYRKFPERFLRISKRYTKQIITIFYTSSSTPNKINEDDIKIYLGWLMINKIIKFDDLIKGTTHFVKDVSQCSVCMKDTHRTYIKCGHYVCKSCAINAVITNINHKKTQLCEVCDYSIRMKKKDDDDD